MQKVKMLNVGVNSSHIMCRFRNAVRSNNIVRINEILSEKYIQQNIDNYSNMFLCFVAEYGTVEIANKLLKLGAKIHNENGKSPIFYAIKNSVEMVKLLLDEKTIIDLNFIRHTLYFGNEEILRLLLQNTIEIKNNENLVIQLENVENLIEFLLNNKNLSLLETKYNYPLLIFFAAKIDKLNILKLILNNCREYLGKNKKGTKKCYRNLEIIDVQNNVGETALHYAVSQQNFNAIRFLLEEGANPNCKNISQLTPLHYSVILENYEISQLLLNFETNANSNNRNNPLHLICGFKLEYIFHGFDDLSIQIFHYYKGKIIYNQEIMKLLLKRGANPNSDGYNGKKLFIHLCQAKRFKEMSILLEFGANICVTDNDGNTALHYIVVNGNFISIVDFLLKNGLEIDVKNNNENTPLMYLIQKEIRPNLKMIEHLIYRGASLNVRNKIGNTAFDIAVYYERSDVVLTLLELGEGKILKHKSSSEYPHITGNVCYGSLMPNSKSQEILISHIALRRDNIDDYFACCLNPIDKWHLSLYWSHYSEKTKGIGVLIFNKTKFEFEKLKSCKILNEIGIFYTYYDFLARDFLTAIRIIKNPLMRQKLLNFKKLPNFYHSKQLLEHRFNLVIGLEDYYDKIVYFFLNYGKLRLPILVVELILSYFSCRDYQLFGKMLSELKN
ncbi:putative ankyrin repeat protein RF_0381 [Leptopilina boulardi]|uniref:putative ankyrin repeat protein RF_0381 n=1 Tax=Leptopilina boulardi TaxID=63433 RepID=UPI0021F51DF8|nr:putative ankyrin repeat protein RF_0381 [Leptopilina boulardi]